MPRSSPRPRCHCSPRTSRDASAQPRRRLVRRHRRHRRQPRPASSVARLTDWISWRAAFLVNVPIAVAMIVGARRRTRRDRRASAAASTSSAPCAPRSAWARWSSGSSSPPRPAGARPAVIGASSSAAVLLAGAGGQRGARRAADHAAAAVPQSRAQRCLRRPDALPGRDDRLLLLHHPVPAGRSRLHPAPGRSRVLADDAGELRRRAGDPAARRHGSATPCCWPAGIGADAGRAWRG